MKDLSSVVLSGNVFWSQLRENKAFTSMALGVNISESIQSVFLTIINPSEEEKALERGSNVLVVNGFLDSYRHKTTNNIMLQVKVITLDILSAALNQEVNQFLLSGSVMSIKGSWALINFYGGKTIKTKEDITREIPVKVEAEDLNTMTSGSKVLIAGHIESIIKDDRNMAIAVSDRVIVR